MGRVYLVNSLQVAAFIAVSCFSMALWPIFSCAIPLSIPPSLPPPMALLFLFIYIPLLSFSILFGPGPEGVMKATPRKNMKIKNNSENENENDDNSEIEKISEMEIIVRQQQKERKAKDEKRFFSYLLFRSVFVAFSVFVTGWLACGSVFTSDGSIENSIDTTDYIR